MHLRTRLEVRDAEELVHGVRRLLHAFEALLVELLLRRLGRLARIERVAENAATAAALILFLFRHFLQTNIASS